MVAAIAPAPTADEKALAARLVETNQTKNRLLRERDQLQERVDQLEDALALARTRAAVGGYRHELRCDQPACSVTIAVITNEPAEPGERLGRALAAAATAMGWIIGTGTGTAEALRALPYWNGGDLCPGCRAKTRAAGKPV